MKSTRFDYVAYDQASCEAQAAAKSQCIALEAVIEELPHCRAKALALTKLEEVYMWIGKAVRDGQIARNGSAELQEGRSNE